MATRRDVEQTVKHVVELRRAARATVDPVQRSRIERVERDLREHLGGSVPKTRAARVLGVSVTTLDKWIARGRLPVVRRPGSTRATIDASALLELAEEVTRLRELGQERAVVATALRRLADQPAEATQMGQPGFFPDGSLERRDERERLTAAERVARAAELSFAATSIAAAAAGRSR